MADADEKLGYDQHQDNEKQDRDDLATSVPGFASRRPDIDNGSAASNLWLVTFTDIMALMLTFFVLLYTMSMPHEEEWSRMTQALNQEFNKYDAYAPQWNAAPQDSINIDRVDFSSALDLDYLSVLLRQTLRDQAGAQNIVFIKNRDRLIISMPSDALFASGQADVLSEGRKTLFMMGEALSKIRNGIEVLGHTDPSPIEKTAGRFESNWHLSLARAANVAGILEASGYRRPIALQGMASARYDELPDDISEEERLSLSRRVDIVILKSTGNKRHGFDLGL